MSKILIILEGEKLDYKIIDSLIKKYDFKSKIEIQIYKTEIYTLYSKIKKNYPDDMDDIDITAILKQKFSDFNFNKDDFGEIYLFFDYDRHHHTASDEKINELLNYFNEETDKGKLYINYPMVESFFHINFENINDYKNATFPIGKGYKSLKIINGNTSIHSNLLKDNSKVNLIFKQNIMKSNFIVNENYSVPSYQEYLNKINQNSIFTNQLKKYVYFNSIGVLSNFPNFIINYFGEKVYKNFITYKVSN